MVTLNIPDLVNSVVDALRISQEVRPSVGRRFDWLRSAEELGINTQGMTIREIFDKVEYKEFAKYMAEREEQK